jgi:hypothetical protein
MKRLQKEMTKTKGKNQQLIKTLMDATFAMRRREIVQNAVSINELLKRFPALTLTSEVYSNHKMLRPMLLACYLHGK